jgi:hypothetical protein
VVAHLPDHGVLVAGDTYANDPGTPELVDYSGGGSAGGEGERARNALRPSGAKICQDLSDHERP